MAGLTYRLGESPTCRRSRARSGVARWPRPPAPPTPAPAPPPLRPRPTGPAHRQGPPTTSPPNPPAGPGPAPGPAPAECGFCPVMHLARPPSTREGRGGWEDTGTVALRRVAQRPQVSLQVRVTPGGRAGLSVARRWDARFYFISCHTRFGKKQIATTTSAFSLVYLKSSGLISKASGGTGLPRAHAVSCPAWH